MTANNRNGKQRYLEKIKEESNNKGEENTQRSSNRNA